MEICRTGLCSHPDQTVGIFLQPPLQIEFVAAAADL